MAIQINPRSRGKQKKDQSMDVEPNYNNERLDITTKRHQQLLNNFHLILKNSKRRANSLNHEEHSLLQNNIVSIRQYLSRKLFDFQTTVFCLQQICSIMNLYQNAVCPLDFNDEIINKMIKCVEDLEHQVDQYKKEQSSQKQIQYNQSYQRILSTILYLIIILIAKHQKQKNQGGDFTKLLEKFFRPNIRFFLITMPLVEEQKNIKFYAVILGHIGQKFPNDKHQKKVMLRTFELLEKLEHDKTVYYLSNFIRQRAKSFSFSSYQVKGDIIISKIKKAIKSRFNNYQISPLLDVYSRFLYDNQQLSEQFYDKEILNCLTDISKPLNIKFPTNCYKNMYFRSAQKIVCQIIKSKRYQQEDQGNIWINFKICQFYTEILESPQIHLQQNIHMLKILSQYIKEETILHLLQKDFLQMLIKACDNPNGNIVVHITEIFRIILKKLENMPCMLRMWVAQNIERKVRELIDSQNYHFSIVLKAKQLKFLAFEQQICSQGLQLY